MPEVQPHNHNQLAISIKECINFYKEYLRVHQYSVTQLGHKQLIGIRNKGEARIVVNLEGISSNQTRIAISHIN